eukprot:6582533-Alexandrium_andersonii.AAC.1
MASGTWLQQELPGPPSFEVRLRRWRVYKAALLLLREPPPGLRRQRQALKQAVRPGCPRAPELQERIRRGPHSAYDPSLADSKGICNTPKRAWGAAIRRSVSPPT